MFEDNYRMRCLLFFFQIIFMFLFFGKYFKMGFILFCDIPCIIIARGRKIDDILMTYDSTAV